MADPSYRLGDELGRGALGRVLRVHDDGGGPVLAGKILHPSQQRDPRAVARFEAEARLFAGLSHPNLVEVHGLIELEGERVLLMELVEGPSLAALIAGAGPLPPARVAAVGRGIAAGLAAAHQAGVIHRDLKPANVLVAAGDVPKIVDFGMARASSFAGVTPEGFAVVGTPDYMAPESIEPLAVDGRSDLYALGCILCELATGRPPYGGATAFAVLEAHRVAPLPELGEVSRPLAEVIRWLLAKSPVDRPQSAAAVERALGQLERDVGSALAVRGERAVAGARRCAGCGAACLPEVPICFSCQEPLVILEPGRYTVFVVGPGEVTHKLDSGLRQRLLDWVRANPALGLEPGALTKRVPRLPFVMLTGVSEQSAERLAAALEGLGLQCVARRGGRFSLRQVRRKGWALGWRVVLIGMISTIPFWNPVVGAVPAALGAWLASGLGAGWYLAGRSAVDRRSRRHAALPAPLTAALDRVAGVVAGISVGRHRDGLRGIVERALALRAALPEAERAELDDELARLVDVATVASVRVDELERALGELDLRNLGDDARQLLRERDTSTARLLEVTAYLDALRARYAALRLSSGSEGADAETLADLRAHIEALEEVRAL